MAYPVVFNAHVVGSLVLGVGVSVHHGTLLDTDGELADASRGRPAAFISLTSDTTGDAATVSVCRSAVFYDSDAPFHAGTPLYLGLAGAITEDHADTSQLVGSGTGAALGVASRYASIALTPAAGFPLAPEVTILSETDQAALADLLVVLRENPGDFANLGEMLEYLEKARA